MILPEQAQVGEIVPNGLARWLFGTSLLVATVVHLAWRSIDLLEWPVLSAALILFLAVPHGALDIEIIKNRRRLNDRTETFGVLAIYAGLAIATLAGWWISPGLSLAAFLVMSAAHFGEDLLPRQGSTCRTDLARRLLLGAALLCATTMLHEREVARVFGWISNSSQAAMIAAFMHVIAPVVLVGAALLTVLEASSSPDQSFVNLALFAATVALPPITAFILYFCFFHSPYHLVSTRIELKDTPSADLARSCWIYVLVPVVGCVLGALLLVQLKAGEALLSSVFITLAALTVPHMLLVERGTGLRHASR